MSVNDALAAIQVIHTVVSKVKDNQDELKSLSKRLQYIVQSLEDSRRRDIIREAEYEDSLSAVFELITRTERVTRRMLKRSLGDRTWNAGEIASDLRRLNEDAQTFLSVHTIKTLDLVQTAQTQQQSYLVSSVEEIIAKASLSALGTTEGPAVTVPSLQITEIDLALSKSTSKPPPMVATPAPPVTAMMLQLSTSNRVSRGQNHVPKGHLRVIPSSTQQHQKGFRSQRTSLWLWWMNRYDEYHGNHHAYPYENQGRVDEKLAEVIFLRTWALFPFFPVSQLGSKVPEDMQKRGGFITARIPARCVAHKLTAGCISPCSGERRSGFHLNADPTGQQSRYLLVASINVISGASVLDTSPLQHGPQDYIVAGEQPWIDGIATGENVVRQFVVTEMGKGYTVEEQPPGDFYRAKSTSEHGHLVAEETGRRFHTVCATPAELDLEGQTIA
ncbi:hypothetical protein FA13DRAFT_1794944 [Coprinellus micaceus]|uniref:Uncharacterized protein n=1 Tax=Coprinellus micaceus TaxID=71717 RepID=A0A4Y7T028_COPMI|nr:hypothetical protein FA13DRAFT_1794944 [Coprinellus micaceus]